MKPASNRPDVDFALGIMNGEIRGPLATLLRGALSILALVYGLGLTLYMLPYRTGLRKRKRLSCPVISIGNLTFGGSGKTPVVRTITAGMLERGVRPVILSRGHGGKSKGQSLIVSDGNNRLVDADQCGDEPAMLADLLPGVPVVVGKNRWKTGELAVDKFSPDVIILDDGMQYWQLHRDVEVVLINAVEPFGCGGLMPRGSLREPTKGLRRATTIVITNSNKVSPEALRVLQQEISHVAPKVEVTRAVHRPSSVRELDGDTFEPGWLSGRKAAAVSSIGSPGLFAATVRELGAEVVREFAYPDHHRWQSPDVRAIDEEARVAGAELLITTEKDAVKLPLGETTLPIMTVDIIVGFDSHDFVGSLLDKVRRHGTRQ